MIGNGALSIGSTSIGSITRIDTVTIDTDLIDATILINRAAGNAWSDTSVIRTDVVSGTIRIGGTQFLQTSDFFVFWIAKESFGTSANRSMIYSLADSIAAADDRSIANIFTFTLSQC